MSQPQIQDFELAYPNFAEVLVCMDELVLQIQNHRTSITQDSNKTSQRNPTEGPVLTE